MAKNLGRYLIKEEIGRGGMATVYLAQDPLFERDVAVKVLPGHFLHDPKFYARFERETKAIAKLEHPAIVPVYDCGEEAGIPYLVMRYMRGGSLAERLKTGLLDYEAICTIVSRIASALDEAHRVGMVHRDVKPANILFDRHGVAYLTDFGIVKVMEATTVFTGSAILGTPDYVSPEQALGEAVDGRSDVYSLGIIIFLMLTGRPPFEADTPMGLVFKHVNEPIPNILQLKSDLPAGCQAMIDKALAKDPAQRFGTAGELSQALTRALIDRPERAETQLVPPPVPAAVQTPKDTGRRIPAKPLLIGCALVAVIVLISCGVGLAMLSNGIDKAVADLHDFIDSLPTLNATAIGNALATVKATVEAPASLTAEAAGATEGSRQDESADRQAGVVVFPGPVTLQLSWDAEPVVDPVHAGNSVQAAVTANIFAGLTRLDPDTGEVLPYLATDWIVDQDSKGFQTYTFFLRQDVPWVRVDGSSGEVMQEVDENGDPRFVNAYDVEYSIKRALDPATGSGYAYVLNIIRNAQIVNEGSENVSLDDLGVEAVDEYTLRFTVEEPAAYFPAITALVVTMPQPEWAIIAWGDRWTEPDHIVTNGPYALADWEHESQLTLVKNPLWPGASQVQIDRVEGAIIIESAAALAAYESGELDTVNVPLSEVERIRDYPQLLQDYSSPTTACTYFYGFTNDKYPFNDDRVRRAFSLAIDRQALIDNVVKGDQLPASSFAPPGIFGAPEPGSVGATYDPEEARANLAEFLVDEGLTLQDFNKLDISLLYNTSDIHEKIALAIQQMWKDELGADVQVSSLPWPSLLEMLRNPTPVGEMPHIWRYGWCADYADENDWVHAAFNTETSDNRLRRNCLDANCGSTTTADFDELTMEAKSEMDPAVRAELYAKAEDILAYREAAYAPLYHYSAPLLTRPWLKWTVPSFGPPFFDAWSIDWAAKVEATEP